MQENKKSTDLMVLKTKLLICKDMNVFTGMKERPQTLDILSLHIKMHVCHVYVSIVFATQQVNSKHLRRGHELRLTLLFESLLPTLNMSLDM